MQNKSSVSTILGLFGKGFSSMGKLVSAAGTKLHSFLGLDGRTDWQIAGDRRAHEQDFHGFNHKDVFGR